MTNRSLLCSALSLVCLAAGCSDASESPDGAMEVHCDPIASLPAIFAAGEGCLIKSIWVQAPCYVSECASPDAGGQQSCNLSQVIVRPPTTRPANGAATVECSVSVEAGTHMYHTFASFTAMSQTCLVSDAISWYWASTRSTPLEVACSHGDGGAQDGQLN